LLLPHFNALLAGQLVAQQMLLPPAALATQLPLWHSAGEPQAKPEVFWSKQLFPPEQ
jgi:hypothetical protein